VLISVAAAALMFLNRRKQAGGNQPPPQLAIPVQETSEYQKVQPMSPIFSPATPNLPYNAAYYVSLLISLRLVLSTDLCTFA
jgi:hypothetical protein